MCIRDRCRRGCTSDAKFVEHVVGIFADNEVTSGFGVRKGALGCWRGDNDVEGESVSQLDLFIEYRDGLRGVQSQAMEYFFGPAF